MSESDANSSLVIRAKRGDRIAIARLLYEAGEKCEEYISSKIPNEFRSLISVDDVVQIARAKVLEQIQSLESNTFPGFLAWFQRIAENALSSEIRVLRAKKRGGDRRKFSETNVNSFAFEAVSDNQPSPPQKLEHEEAIVALKANLNDLPTTERNVLRHHHIDSRSLNETAKLMGKSPGKIRGLLARAKHSIKQKMGSSSKWFSK